MTSQKTDMQGVPQRLESLDKRSFFALSVGALVSLVATGCENVPKPSLTATLFNNEKIHQAMDELDGSLQELESAVEEFDSENWREVVPRVRDGVEEMRGHLETLQHELGYSPQPF